MRNFAFWVLLTASMAFGQDVLWLDLSGEWKFSRDDRPEYALPNLDDASWRTGILPSGDNPVFRFNTGGPSVLWCRRSVELPADDRRTSPLALTLGKIRGVYEVYVNGQRIGGTGSIASVAGAPMPRPFTWLISPESLSRGRSVSIAIRVRLGLTQHPIHRLPDEGPWLLTSAAVAPWHAGDEALRKQRDRNVLVAVFAAVFLCLACISFFAWWGDRSRRELLWFAIVCLSRVGAAALLVAMLFPAFPSLFNSWGIPVSQYVLQTLAYPLICQLTVAVYGRRRFLLWSGLVWLAWAPHLIAVSTGPLLPDLALASTIGITATAVYLIVRDWLTSDPASRTVRDHALRFTLLFAVLSSLETRLSDAGISRFFPAVFHVGPYEVQRLDVAWLLVSLGILGLILSKARSDQMDRQRLAQELAAARQIQRLLVTGGSGGTDLFPVEIEYLPAREVGGDFTQAVTLEDGSVLVLSGDVSGKGLGAAMVVSMVIGAFANRRSNAPGAVLGELNQSLQGRLDGAFVTCCCVLVDPKGSLTLANAGHVAPYLSGQETEVDSGLPLGIARDVTYSQTDGSLTPGAQLTVVSDGVVEAADAHGDLFGFDRTRDLSTKSAREIAEAARAWGQNDDITVVTVRRCG